IDHRKEVITRRSEFDLRKARARAHILDGLLIALANLDDVVQTIRQSPDVEQAKIRLVTRFKLSEIQAQAILDMQLRRLAALERQKIEDEHQEVMTRIAYLEDLLENPVKILGVIQQDINEMSEKYGDDRRTLIAADARENLREEDLVADQSVLVIITMRGYIKRVTTSAFRLLGRGRRGVTGQAVREEDEVMVILPARTLHTILFFSDRGKVYAEKTYQIPDAGRAERGIPIVNVLALEPNERITAAVAVPEFSENAYCVMATVKGRVKRISLSEFASVRPSGMIAMNLDQGDQLGWVRLTGGKDDILFVTRNGKALRYSEKEVRAVGRTAAGVTGIKLDKGQADIVTSMEVIEPGGSLVVVTEKGYGKRTPLTDYPVKGRATGGVATLDHKNMDKSGFIAAARVAQEEDELTVITNAGIVLRLRVKAISAMGRATRGSRIMDLGSGSMVASVARFRAIDVVNVDPAPEE
ncbi:MAG TPA: DNA gyrase C-terminal beta-propeller domain-containing protein, partial [Anaerolineaceae bacterium]|nr:DNA gyrase C-terminal beta-propeller domain-containing protein [Anaerolineaceae bacterium]